MQWMFKMLNRVKTHIFGFLPAVAIVFCLLLANDNECHPTHKRSDSVMACMTKQTGRWFRALL